MEFIEMRDALVAHFKEMTKDVNHLFEVEVDKDELWNLYLDSFPPGTNEIYRERREYDCSCCRHFIKAIGNAVAIKDNKVTTLWDFETEDPMWHPILKALSKFIHSHAVTDVYIAESTQFGCKENYELRPDGTRETYVHFYLDVPTRFGNTSSKSIGTVKGNYRAIKNVFKRSLEEITEESVNTVLELIASNTLYKGEEWKKILQAFLKYKKDYEKVPVEDQDNYVWEKSLIAGTVIGKIRNHSIGTLLVDISEGVDLDTAVRKYEQIVAPTNYKRPKAIYTKKMLEDAKKTLTELGYMESLERRFATLDDITVNNILFSNKDAAKRIAGAMDIFGEMEKEVAVNPKRFAKVEEVTVDKFLTDVLPLTSELEVYLENKHAGNMVSLIAPKHLDSKSMFKWGNNFGWAYSGNVTDSMKERVKAAGGKIDGDLRFSIQWNEDGKDDCDLDAHCYEEDGAHIYFDNKKSRYTDGKLDVDIISPGTRVAVENITWATRETMKPGKYAFFVKQFSGSAKHGFRAEIEFDGQIYSFDYDKRMRAGEFIRVADVTLWKNGTFTIKEFLNSQTSSKEIWGLNSNQFVPVSVVCFSPNYWDEQKGIGHKHVFFMLKDCINPEQPNGFFNEYLKEELMQHKRVFEALGSKMAVADVDDQLSGIGFSTTKRDDVIVKVKGVTERVLKIKF